jgi:hypothetical protein
MIRLHRENDDNTNQKGMWCLIRHERKAQRRECDAKSVVHAADVAGLPVRGDSAIFEECGKNKLAAVGGAVAFSVNRVGSAMVDVNEECSLFLPPQSQLGWTGLIQLSIKVGSAATVAVVTVTVWCKLTYNPLVSESKF